MMKLLLTQLAESAARALRAEAAMVCLLDESGERLSVAAIYGLPAELVDHAQDIKLCAIDRQALAGAPVVVTDTQSDSRPSQSWLDKSWSAEICFPLLYEKHPLGTLHVYAATPKGLDAATLEPLAKLGASCIALAREVERLKKLEANQAQFVRVATHELRSPITVSQSLVRSVLKGYAGAMTEKQTEVFTRIGRRLDLMESLVNDLLDLAAGKTPGWVEPEPIALDASLRRVILLLQPRAEDKNISLTLHAGRKPLIVRGTEEGLDRIFVNLIGNAIKYTPAGGSVTVSARAVEGQARIEISDTGIGIPKEALPHLFQEFYRAPNAKKMAEAGTGLGLAIVKDLVQRFGGRISVDSEGQGTTFTVMFPL